MSCKNTQKKTKQTNGFNLNSISGVLNLILTAFSIPEEPAQTLPPPLILLGAKMRPGLSANKIASRIISRQSEAGLPVGDVFADGPNTSEAMEAIRAEEIVNAILTEAKVTVAIQPGIQVSTVGVGNLGAPVVSQGATTNVVNSEGIIS
jgi:hypothetical protein